MCMEFHPHIVEMIIQVADRLGKKWSDLNSMYVQLHSIVNEKMGPYKLLLSKLNDQATSIPGCQFKPLSANFNEFMKDYSALTKLYNDQIV